MQLRSKKQLKVCEQPAPRSLLRSPHCKCLVIHASAAVIRAGGSKSVSGKDRVPSTLSHTVDDAKVEFSKDAFSLEAEKPEWRFQAWRRHTQTALFVSSQDRRAKEKHCVFIRQDRAAKGVFAPFSLTSAGKSASSTHEASSCCIHPAGSVLPATSTKGAKSSWVDTEWPQHCIWKGTHTWTRTDRLSVTAQSGRWAKLLSFFPVFLYI